MLSDVGGGVSSATISLTSSQISNANTTPTELIPAPGAEKAINIIRASVVYTYGTSTYIQSASPLIAYKGGVSYYGVNNLGSLLTNTTSTYTNFGTNQFSYGTGVINDTPIYFYAASDLFVGDGTLKINIVYSIIDL
jgi:hypothetical protein